jgi:oligo-1,6-glucosidase
MSTATFPFRFEANYPSWDNSEPGDLYIFGSDESLGHWKVEDARPMRWCRRNKWIYSDIHLPSSFQYKYFFKTVRGAILMEECETRLVNIEEDAKQSGEIVQVCVQDEYSQSSHKQIDISRKRWWKEPIVYQIYPRSFCDSNGDGIGDIQGIISKLDYLKDLGVGVIWLSPVYKSPNDDNGYDISDYQEISSDFGTLRDWEELLDQIHQRDMKLVMDLVVNHTSDEHPWFINARKSKDNPYRDYYVWKPPHAVTGKEPNNWKSFFGGSTWELDPITGEYYLHLFSKKQPDLNWENPKLREEIFNMMHFWLQKGIDGFRMDVINVISKVPSFPDAIEKVEGPYHWGGDFFVNGPRLMEFLQEMKQKVLTKYNLLTVGETPFFGVEDACRLTNETAGVVNMLFHFELMSVDSVPGKEKWECQPWRLSDIKSVMTGWQMELQGKGWNSLYLENHDQPRSVSRFGDDVNYHSHAAKMLATWLHMMQGTVYIYQGQEIGMTNANFSSMDDYKDLESRFAYEEMITLQKMHPNDALKAIQLKSRDNARTPMQWDSSTNAGFSTGIPWIKVNSNFAEINVQRQEKDPNSILQYYKRLVQLRKQHDVIVYGTYHPLAEEDRRIYAYKRTFHGQTLVVIANFSADSPTFAMPTDIVYSSKKVLISNYDVDAEQPLESIDLLPYEARVYLLA